AAVTLIRLIRPVASSALQLYAAVSPDGDRRLLLRPEFGAMFLDDLLNGSRKQMSAPFADIVVFARHWGFRLDEVKVPVHWWHGDADHIIPFAHGQHVASLLPDAHLYPIPGESHLAGLGRAEEILRTLLAVWDREEQTSSDD
ncbi:alpha/beta fold hydrolase, partial [Aldersonia kunmingensis]|uniref:alpha/beta fold hydrolase n=1 Tax=Aldersonia kunmingensis TaxID=408066 RepID=UPI000B18415F